jgi:hypothetical protein
MFMTLTEFLATGPTREQWDILKKLWRGHCFYCGKQTRKRGIDREGPYQMTKDHVLPRSRGGRRPFNIVPACRPCNRDKRSRDLEQFRQRVAHKQGVDAAAFLFHGEVGYFERLEKICAALAQPAEPLACTQRFKTSILGVVCQVLCNPSSGLAGAVSKTERR